MSEIIGRSFTVRGTALTFMTRKKHSTHSHFAAAFLVALSLLGSPPAFGQRSSATPDDADAAKNKQDDDTKPEKEKRGSFVIAPIPH